jgi:hypothetical protein
LWLWDFSGTHELLLSDNPCILTKHIDDPDVIIALPLSPTRAFMATRSDRVAAALRQQNKRQLAMRLNETSIGQARGYTQNDIAAIMGGNFMRNKRSPSEASTVSILIQQASAASFGIQRSRVLVSSFWRRALRPISTGTELQKVASASRRLANMVAGHLSRRVRPQKTCVKQLGMAAIL